MDSVIGSTSPTVILVAAAVLGFVAAMLAVLGGGDAIAARFVRERGGYEAMIGEEIYRLFLPITPQMFFLYHMFGILFLMGLGAILMEGNWFMGAMFGLVIGIFAPRFWLKRMWRKRIMHIDAQVEESMVYMANSFKANPALPDAFQDVVNSMPPPISQEFEVMLKEYKLGTPLDNALINLQRRVPSKNLQLAIAALLIGRSVGGNIPKILEDIAGTIRESYRLERVIDAQTAQGRMQAWVIGMAPLTVLGAFYLLDPDLIRPLFSTYIGYIVLAIAAAMNILGIAFILKIVSIRV